MRLDISEFLAEFQKLFVLTPKHLVGLVTLDASHDQIGRCYMLRFAKIFSDIIEVAGCENAAADIEGWSISTEELLELDPYIILVPSWGYDAFLETEPYTELTAVQEGRVLSVDPNIFERIGPRNVDAVRTVFEYALDANAVAHAGS